MQKLKKIVIRLVLWAILLAGVFYLWKNPAVLSEAKDYLGKFYDEPKVEKIENSVKDSRLEDLSREVDELSYRIRKLEQTPEPLENVLQQDFSIEIAEIKEKLAVIEKVNLNVIDSKADASSILGLIARTDRLEEKISNIAKISDKGALISTAAVLVRDRDERGESFGFEAEVLAQLSDNEPKIKEAVDAIVGMSGDGVATNHQLISEFNRIHKGEGLQGSQANWQERLKAKLGEVVQVKKTNTKEEVKPSNMKEIKSLVNKGMFFKAVELLDEENNDKFLRWKEDARKRIVFDRAISKITSYSLALMKVNLLRGSNE